MEFEVVVEPLSLFGVCNLCLDETSAENMIVGNKHNGNTEIYSDMLFKCFSINITQLDLGETKKLICHQCITKLRMCIAFREQVEKALSNLQATIQQDKKDVNEEKVDKELIEKIEKTDDDDVFDNDTHDDGTTRDIDEAKVFTNKEKRSPQKRSPSKSKSKRLLQLKIKRAIDITNTESMIAAGLFPFKIKSDGKFSCTICPEKCTRLDDMKKHIIGHDLSNLHVAFQKAMFSKLARFYKSSNMLRCKLCTSDVSNFEELEKHLDTCSRVKFPRKWSKLPFKLEKGQLDCPICKKNFLNYANLNNHMNVHYPNYICENCGKAFASETRLRSHMRTHEDGNFPCRYCNAIFDRATKRDNHTSKEHKSGVRYACKRCDIYFTSFYARQKHLAEVHDEELKRYKCNMCPQSYITPGHLSTHIRRDHLNERNHKCEKCDLAFYTKNALTMHMIKHDGERIHTCPVCLKSYQRSKTLREHLRIHNNDKRFVCPVCGRAFTQKCTLKGHLKVHETEMKNEMIKNRPATREN